MNYKLLLAALATFVSFALAASAAAPELNPVERLWAYLRSHYLSNRAYENYRALLDAGAQAWQHLTPEVLKTVCACPYLSRMEGV